MIAWIQGVLLEKSMDKTSTLVIATHGVGYLVETSMHTFGQLPDIDVMTTLYIHTIIREDAHLLYGFYDKAEREMFQLLIKVSGVGPKLALAMLSGMIYTDLARCITQKNVARLHQLPGIGKKTAERLIIEMQDKIKDLLYMNWANTAQADTADTIDMRTAILPFPQNLPIVQDVMSALSTLGYKLPQITLAIESLVIEDKSSEQLIREALQYFTRR